MYKIGEFSKITNLTVKALRYYEEEGILMPSNRLDNEYRMYNEEDYEKAMLIVTLRRFDFSIAEIKDTLNNCESMEDFYYFLEEKKTFILKHMREEKTLMKEIDYYLNQSKKEVNGINNEKTNQSKKEKYPLNIDQVLRYTFEIKDIEATKVALIRFRGSYEDVGKYIGTIYKRVKNKINGAPFNCYYDNEYKELADIELCVPTKELVSGKDITAKELPKIRAVCTTHIGSYNTLNLAYKAIIDYMKDNNYKYKLPSREIYHKGPGMILRGNPAKYITEIILPIEKE